MPNETQYYVPKLQAIKNIVAEPAKYGVVLPSIDNAPYFIAVHKTRDIDVETAAKLAEMKVDDFRALNPAFNRPVILGAGGGATIAACHQSRKVSGEPCSLGIHRSAARELDDLSDRCSRYVGLGSEASRD